MRAYGIALAAWLIAGLSSGTALAQSPPSVDWSGFYVGGMVGGANHKSQVQTIVGAQKYLDAQDARQMDRAGNTDMLQWQPVAGVLGGYGRQFGNILIGIEASANSLSLNDEHTIREAYDSRPISTFTLKQSVSADWMATLRPRLGWAEDNWLGYVTGGLAVTQLKLDTLFTDTAFNGFSQSSQSEIKVGWSLGLGGEYALDENWAFRGEYLYTNFGQIESWGETFSTNNGGGALRHTAELSTHTIMLGLTYHFR